MLNKQQKEASKMIKEWFDGKRKIIHPIFSLAGYAGTGKTFLISYILKNILFLDREQVAYITPTGKAASVLIQKGMKNTRTLHKLIYIPVKKEKKDKEKEIVLKELRFIKKEEISHYKLIILDEVSMVSKKQMEDLLSFNIPILCCGDPGQLPPVMAEGHDLLAFPDYTLTDIVRQSADNEIIKVATMARNKEFIKYGWHGKDVLVLDYKNIKPEIFNTMLLKSDQILSGKHETREYINNYVRKLKGFTSELPSDGDKIICLKNNYEIDLDTEANYSLVNGIIGYVENFYENNSEDYISSFDFKADFLDEVTEEIVIDDRNFRGLHKSNYDNDIVYKLSNDKMVRAFSYSEIPDKENKTAYRKYLEDMKKETQNRLLAEDEKTLNHFDFAYAITVHKSQGSEWDTVLVIDESNSFYGFREKWLYTAITRAKKKLIIIRNFANKKR